MFEKSRLLPRLLAAMNDQPALPSITDVQRRSNCLNFFRYWATHLRSQESVVNFRSLYRSIGPLRRHFDAQ